jgi:hypothetical protein
MTHCKLMSACPPLKLDVCHICCDGHVRSTCPMVDHNLHNLRTTWRPVRKYLRLEPARGFVYSLGRAMVEGAGCSDCC